LKKQIKPQKKAARTNTNTAKAVVNITNPPRRRYVNRKAFQSGLNDLNRVIVSSGNNNKNTDLINHLINRDKQNSIPAPEPPKSQNLLNYSEINRISGMLKDDRLPDIFQKNFPYKETKLLMQDYALEHLLRQNEPRQVNKQPSFANQNLQQDPKTYDYAPKSPSFVFHQKSKNDLAKRIGRIEKLKKKSDYALFINFIVISLLYHRIL